MPNKKGLSLFLNKILRIKLRLQWGGIRYRVRIPQNFYGYNEAGAENGNPRAEAGIRLGGYNGTISAFRTRTRERNLMARPSLKFFIARGKFDKLKL